MKYTEYEILNKIKKRKPKEELDKEYKNNFFYRNKLHYYLEQNFLLSHGLDPLQMDKLILNEEAKNEMYKFETENITRRLQEILAKRDKIYKGIKRIFNNKQAAEREGFYALDLNNLAKKFYNGNGGSTSVIRPKELTQYINEHQDADILTIHNHKGDNLPSPADLLSNSRSNSHKALIVGNSGSIYFIDTKKADYSTLLEKFEFEEYPRGEWKEEKFKQICDKYNVKFVCLRKENDKNENINGGPNKSKN